MVSTWAVVSVDRMELSYKGNVFQVVEGEDTIKAILSIWDVEEFQVGSTEETFIQSEQEEREREERRIYLLTYCNECEKKLPKQYYRYEGKNLCKKCYGKKDTLINSIKIKQ